MINLFDRKDNCCGCTACMNICPTNAIIMKNDEEGFLYPIIDNDLCIECKLCKKVCGFQNENSFSDYSRDVKVYAAKHKDIDIRMKSTSGGVFTALSDFVLENRGVIFGASLDSKMKVCHKKVYTKIERDKLRGSKYVQSDLRDSFSEIKELLGKDKKVLFTGTPCQCDGLKEYLKNINTDNLVLCDIVCHGVPSPRIFDDYLKMLNSKSSSKVKGYYWRDKVNGWHTHTEKVVYEDGSEDFKSKITKIYKELFYSHSILRPACHNCKYTNLNRCSDITIADFWGIEKIMPEFDDNKGVSLVILNSNKGRDLFDNIKVSLDYKESNIRDCLQPQLQYPSRESHNRSEFWNDYNKYGFEYIAKKYTSYGFIRKIKTKMIILLKKLGVFQLIFKIIKK